MWDNAEGPEITKQEVNDAYTETIASLDDGFFRVRLDRLTPRETGFVTVMAALGDGPYAMNDIARVLKKQLPSLGPVRAKTISKGMIYSTEHGFLDFSVPLFRISCAVKRDFQAGGYCHNVAMSAPLVLSNMK